MRATLLALSVALAAPAAFAQNNTPPGTPSAQNPPRPAAGSTPTTGATATAQSPAATPSGHGMTPFVTALSHGFQAYGRHDYGAAIQAFQEAENLDRQSPWPRLYIGFAQAARGDAATALSSFRDAQRRATVASDDGARARAMGAVALLLEGQTHWDDARIAWQDYATFTDAHAQSGYPVVARQRVQAIQQRATLVEQSQAVRQRIADRQRINAEGATPPAAPPATGAR